MNYIQEFDGNVKVNGSLTVEEGMGNIGLDEYDLVIKTQEEFDAFLAHEGVPIPNVTSVLIYGGGGDGEDGRYSLNVHTLLLPSNLLLLEGKDNAIINSPEQDFGGIYNHTIQFGTKAAGASCVIKNITAVNGRAGHMIGSDFYALAPFYNCSNLHNCTAKIGQYGTSSGIGFLNCDNSYDCSAETVSGYTVPTGFKDCTNIFFPKIKLIKEGEGPIGTGFVNCDNIVGPINDGCTTLYGEGNTRVANGDYVNLINKPTLGTLAEKNSVNTSDIGDTVQLLRLIGSLPFSSSKFSYTGSELKAILDPTGSRTKSQSMVGFKASKYLNFETNKRVAIKRTNTAINFFSLGLINVDVLTGATPAFINAVVDAGASIILIGSGISLFRYSNAVTHGKLYAVDASGLNYSISNSKYTVFLNSLLPSDALDLDAEDFVITTDDGNAPSEAFDLLIYMEN